MGWPWWRGERLHVSVLLSATQEGQRSSDNKNQIRALDHKNDSVVEEEDVARRRGDTSLVKRPHLACNAVQAPKQPLIQSP
jgi:hypothetical protein